MEPEGYLINPEKLGVGKWRIRYEGKKALAAIPKAADAEWCTAHTLRHSFARQLVIAGVSLYKVSQWLGHSSQFMTEHYGHYIQPDSATLDLFGK